MVQVVVASCWVLLQKSNFLLLQLYFSFVRELTEICTHSFYDTFQIELLHYFWSLSKK